jgi:hypothetical protein
MDGVRIVKVDGLTHEVRAVMKHNIEMTVVGPGVEHLNEGVVLLRSSFDAKGITGSVVCGAHELCPIVRGRTAVLVVGCDLPKVAPPIFVPQDYYVFLTRAQRNLIRPIYRVEVRQQRNRDPIVAADTIVTADHDSLLTLVASP